MTFTNRVIHLMGTVISLQIDHEKPNDILDSLEVKLKEYEHRFSANDETSELMKINQNAGIQSVTVDPELFELIAIGKKHSMASDSLLNIAIGPLVQTWRIGFSDAKVPSELEIKEKLRLIDPGNICLNSENKTVYLNKKGMKIDLGCLAKGYIADCLLRDLKKLGVKSALLNLGGNIVTLGPSPNATFWRIGIQHPDLERNQSLEVLKIEDESVVTSGIYERHLEKQGKSYHHILDPNTGYPVESEVLSLTIVSKKSVDGEIWTTRLFGKMEQEILVELNRQPGVEGYIITKHGCSYSNGLKNKLMITKKEGILS